MNLMNSAINRHRLCAQSLVVLLALCSSVLVASEQDKPLTNEDIKQMVDKGLGARTIIAMIETRPGSYDVSRKALKALKCDGVDDEITVAMIKAAKGAEDSARLQPIIGPALTWYFDDHVDFKQVQAEDRYIFIDNDSRFKPELMTGLLLRVWDFKGKNWKHQKTIDIVAALEFTEGGQAPLDGVFLGGGLGLTPAIEIVVGYSRSRGKVLSHGFKRNMSQFVKTQQDQEDSMYQDIRLEDEAIADVKDYDGLPLYTDTENKSGKIYPGHPLSNSFHSRLSVGILVKFDIIKAFEKVVH